MYECCRITGVLYSNAVVFALPNSGWHVAIVRTLREMLETSDLGNWAVDSTALLLWALFVGGIASYATEDRGFFEQSLRTCVVSNRLIEWSAVQALVRQFLWSNSACGSGAAALWDALGLDSL